MAIRPLSLVRELIGGPQRLVRYFTNVVASTLEPTVDSGHGDYRFYDKLRRGKAKGLELSGLLAKPLYSKVAAWVLGSPPIFRTENEAAQERLTDWWTEWHPRILSAYEDALGLGDCYLVVNPDLSLVIKPPHVVRPIVNPDDFSDIIGWEIREVYKHPTDVGNTMIITDRYTATQRDRRVEVNGRIVEDRTYPNFAGRVPVIHMPNLRYADQMFGTSEAESLIELFHRYGETIEAALDGHKRQGRPTPTIERLGSERDVKAFWDQYGKTRTIIQPDGSTVTENYLEFDADKVVTLGGDATFNWKSPASFTGDTSNLLGLLFYLYVQHSEMPEWVLGNAIASSMASARTQVEPLVKFVEKKRGLARFWVNELAQVALAFMGVADTVVQDVDLSVRWETLTNEDGTLTLSAIQWLYSEGMIDKETAVQLAPVEIENPAEAIERAEQEREARDERERQDSMDRALAQARQNASADEDTPDTDSADQDTARRDVEARPVALQRAG